MNITINKIIEAGEILSQLKRSLEADYVKTLKDANIQIGDKISYKGHNYTVISIEQFLKANGENSIGGYIESPYCRNSLLKDLSYSYGKVAVMDDDGVWDVIAYKI